MTKPRYSSGASIGYAYEEKKSGSFWRFDERYYEHGVGTLYERFCYAMTIIVDRLHAECVALYDIKDPRFESLSDVQRRSTTFEVFLSGAVDEIFKRGRTRDMGWSDSVQEYCGQDYTSDEFESFWARHQKLLSDITSLRNTYKPEERTYLHGFTDRDYDEDDDDKSWNLDCVFMMRVCSTISSVTDVEKFLGRTKRDYLPIIIKAFMTTPKTDFFAPNPWWQFWKRGKG
jgi:hypothetical protein